MITNKRHFTLHYMPSQEAIVHSIQNSHRNNLAFSSNGKKNEYSNWINTLATIKDNKNKPEIYSSRVNPKRKLQKLYACILKQSIMSLEHKSYYTFTNPRIVQMWVIRYDCNQSWKRNENHNWQH